MGERRIEHTFACTVDTFWSLVLFNEDYDDALFRGRLKFERWEVVQKKDSPDGLRRVIEAVPRLGNLPGPLKRLLKNGAGYREEGEFKRSESRYDVVAISASLPDRLLVTGEMTVTPEGEGRCRRVYVAKVRAKIFGLGSLLEDHVLDSIQKSYDKSAEFTDKWLEQHGLVGQ